MPTEYRFDELDLREEPARAERSFDAEPTTTATGYTHICTATRACTHICCTQTTVTIP
jgi:hypothetical protein